MHSQSKLSVLSECKIFIRCKILSILYGIQDSNVLGSEWCERAERRLLSKDQPEMGGLEKCTSP